MSVDKVATNQTLRRTDIYQRLFRNSGIAIVGRLVTAVASLICIPVVVGKLGMAGYGTWEAIAAFAAFISVLQTPISGTLLWRIASAYGSESPEQAKRSVRIGVGAALILCITFTPIALWARYPLVSFLNVPREHRDAAASLLVLLVGVTALGVVNDTLGALVSGYQRAGIVIFIQAAASVLNYSATIVGLVLGWGLWSLWAGLACGSLFVGCGLYFAGRRVCGNISLVPALPRASGLRAVWRYSGLLLIGSISAALRGQTDRVILASAASPVWTAYYGIATRLAGLVVDASNFFYTPTFAAAGALHSSGDWEGVKRLYSRMMSLVPLVVGAVVVVILSLYDRLMVFWLGREVPEAVTILHLLVSANAIAIILTGPGTALCKGIGRAGIETTYVVVSLILNVALTILLVVWLGAIGTVVASAISWAAGAGLFLFILHRRVDLPLEASLRGVRALLTILVTACLARLVIAGVGFGLSSRFDAFVSAVILGLPVLSVLLCAMVATGVLGVKRFGNAKAWPLLGSYRVHADY